MTRKKGHSCFLFPLKLCPGHSFKGKKKHEQKLKVTKKIGWGTMMIVSKDLIFGRMLC